MTTDDDLSERFEVARGRSSGPFVMVPLWVMLNASAKARALYEALAAHRDWWATGHLVEDVEVSALASLIDVADRKSVRRYVRELEDLGAVEVVRRTTPEGMLGANVYVIHDVPPDGFARPRTLKEYYAENGKAAGQYDGVSAPHRNKQGKDRKPDSSKAGKTGKNDVHAGRSDGASAPHPPYKKGVRKNPPSSPPRHTGDTGIAGAPSAREGEDRSQDGITSGSAASVPPPRSAPEDETDLTARELLTSLPTPVAIGTRAVRDLTPIVAEALAAGWTAEALTAHLTAELPARVRSARALLMHRLEDLPPAPPAAADERPALPPRCGDFRHDPLAPHDRLLYPPGEAPRRCPACHPAVLQDGGVR